METIDNLIEDLEKLNKEYLGALELVGIPKTREDVAKYDEFLIKSGQMIIDFYDKIFTSKYLNSKDECVSEVGFYLEDLSYNARRFIESKNDFGLAVLLIPKESREGDPNKLENLINLLKTSSQI